MFSVIKRDELFFYTVESGHHLQTLLLFEVRETAK